MYSMRRLTIGILVFTLFTPAARQRTIRAQSAQAVKTVNRRGAKVFYYENPPVVAVAATFYVIGSQQDSMWRDFLALTANFVVRGWTVTEPQFVQFHFVSSTRTKGGKYGTNHRLTILTDGELLLSADLVVGPPVPNRRGGSVETLALPQMSFKHFAELAQAKEVRMRLGSTEFKMKNKHLEALRSMLTSIGS